ncbi:hypothetical protein [Stutzerimonas chloritidismutans]|uniref:hypothetical protein n=1 Tax=Stutzerimonas chloritidismutans TaxID=203192 RepID=UPI003F145B68
MTITFLWPLAALRRAPDAFQMAVARFAPNGSVGQAALIIREAGLAIYTHA